jgi:hypothetical protein
MTSLAIDQLRDVNGLLAADERLDVVRPALHRRLLLLRILSLIVDARDAALVARDVVHVGLDDVRRNSEFSHAGNHGSPQVAELPWLGEP